MATFRSKRLSDEQRKQLAQVAGGITPLEFACSVLRDENATFSDRRWACELLMPYMHRKLPTAVDLNTTQTITSFDPETLRNLKPAELNVLLDMVQKVTRQEEVKT